MRSVVKDPVASHMTLSAELLNLDSFRECMWFVGLVALWAKFRRTVPWKRVIRERSSATFVDCFEVGGAFEFSYENMKIRIYRNG